MEGSESEAVFDSLDLNPQLFVNEVLNTVDDVVDEAFHFFYEEGSGKVNTDGSTRRSQDLKKGVDCIRQKVQSVLDKRLAIWEKYCLHHCFSVPQGFHMPNTDEPSENSLHQDFPFNPDVDSQLDSLRRRLSEVGKESEMLNQEVQALERESTLNARYVNEAVQLCNQNSLHELFQEIMSAASELETKMKKLNNSMVDESKQIKTKRIYSTELDLSSINPAAGLSNMELDSLQEFLSSMKST